MFVKRNGHDRHLLISVAGRYHGAQFRPNKPLVRYIFSGDSFDQKTIVQQKGAATPFALNFAGY